LIHAKHTELKLHLAGRGFPESLIDHSIPNVSFTGAVKDAQEFMQDKQIMIVPLHSGSGLRIKILQGLALGKTIIATTVGAEGIDVTDGKNILIANTPEEFEQKVTYCLSDETRCKAIGLAGRKLIEEKYSSTALGEKVADYYRLLLR
jgi:glycosyltransferase involved in cell wall biosynthesis